MAYTKILITGGAGYIGSHVCVELVQLGYDVVILDNFCNSSPQVIDRIQEITGKRLKFYKGDVRSSVILKTIFTEQVITTVIHFAGLKSVGESVKNPLTYYENNVTGSVNLFKVMAEFNCKSLVFSSSATVYGDPEYVPITEDARLNAVNPYGRTKLMVEDILSDLSQSDSNWSIAILRYFNPVGAHPSGLIGESPSGMPSNLLPFISQVAIGKRDKLKIFGNDYSTPDGTGIRDYIHIMDLAKGHVKALGKTQSEQGLLVFNLGTGRGYSVLEVVRAFETASGKSVPFEIVERRPGDVAECFAEPSKAQKILGWKAELGINEMCRDAWRWQSLNPEGLM